MARAQAGPGHPRGARADGAVDRRELVDEYARLREQLKAREREIQALKLKLATGAAARRGRRPLEVGGALVWTPRFEGLDRKAHAAVVDDFRNRHKGRRLRAASRPPSTEDGVSVIAAVSARPDGAAQGARDHEAAGPARRRTARLRPGRRCRARATSRRCADRRGELLERAAGEGAACLGRLRRSSAGSSRWRRPAGAAPRAARRRSTRASNANGVVEATNVPDDSGFRLTYPGKGTLIHSRGFRRKLRAASYDRHIDAAVDASTGVAADLVQAVIQVESEFDQLGGLLQGRAGPDAAHARHRARASVSSTPSTPRQNIFGGTQYLRILLDLFHGDVDARARRPTTPARTPCCATAAFRPTGRRAATSQKVQALLGGFSSTRPRSSAASFYAPSVAGSAARERRQGPARARARARSSPPGPATYYRWRDERGMTARRRGAAARGHRLRHRARARLIMADPIPPRPVRPGPVPDPLQQGPGALRCTAASTRPSASSRRPTCCGRATRGCSTCSGSSTSAATSSSKAEEVYRKLIAESPEAHTLHYNLGLDLLQAEPAGRRRVGLRQGARADAGATPRSTSTSGSIYERLQRYKDAIYQYRQAGAHMLVQRLEGRIGEKAHADATAPPPGLTPPRPHVEPDDGPGTKPPRASPRPSPHRPRRPASRFSPARPWNP